MKALLIVISVLTITSVSLADSISLCSKSPDSLNIQTQALRTIENEHGLFRYLYVTPERLEDASCHSKDIPISYYDVLWTGLTSPMQWDTIKAATRISFSGQITSQKFLGSIDLPPTSPESKPSTAIWPTFTDIKNRIQITPYGEEERAKVRQEKGVLTLSCDKGNRPGGFIVRFDNNTLPSLSQLAISVSYRGHGDWVLMGVDTHSTDKDPTPIHQLKPTDEWGEALIYTDELTRTSSNALGFVCPNAAESLELSKLELKAPNGSEGATRSTWIWESSTWQHPPEGFWNRLTQLKINRLFVAFNLDRSGSRLINNTQIKRFVREANSHHIEVWAVEGSPRAVIDKERAPWILRAKAYQHYNNASAVRDRIKGIQFDIEPYINEGYQLDPDHWKSNYLEVLQSINKVVDLPIDVAIPYWWNNEMMGEHAFVPMINGVVDSLTIMDYRTDPFEVVTMAIPFLQFESTTGKSISIALETGDLGTDTQWRFQKASSGTLLAVELGGTVIFVKSAHSFSKEGAPVFDLVETKELRSSNTSFFGKQEYLESILEPIDKSLRAWQTFNGLALHEVLKNH
jgi:hypothetical protein